MFSCYPPCVVCNVASKITQEIVKQVKQSGKTVRETQELIDKNNSQNRIYQVTEVEQQELREHFSFKNKKPIVRELRENEIAHALKSHGDIHKEASRGNIAINRNDIEQNYPKITQDYDEKFFTDKSIIYAKQINGHHIAIEEALKGQDKLIFKTMWKTKGNYNKEVLLKNVKATPYPQNADEAVKQNAISKLNIEQGIRYNLTLSLILPQKQKKVKPQKKYKILQHKQ